MKTARSYGRFRSRVFLVVIALIALYLLISQFYLDSQPPYSFYTDLKLAEEKSARKYLENQKNAKYLLLRQNQADFANQAQQILLHHHLALQSSRTYIYQPFDWKARRQQLPLSAFLLGPTQQSVPSSLVEELCPKGSSDVVNIKIESSHTDLWKTALDALKRKEKCVIVDNPILDSNYLSSPAAQSIWPLFQKYLSRYFQWSPQILDIAEQAHTFLKLRSHFSSFTGERYMALHLHRADFVDRCKTAAKEKTGFPDWANLPSVLSTTLSPHLNTENTTSVMEHCYPPLSRIMEAIDHHARRKPYLHAIHIIHDGAVSSDIWKLEAALKNRERAERAGWPSGPIKAITHSGMVPHEPHEKDFLFGVDAEMARRADVFIGNGYSSLTSYIVALRMGADFIAAGVLDDITLL